MNSILDIRELRKAYDGFTLDSVSFAVPQGYIMGFIGPNGSGKTTTLKAVLNVIHRDSGTVTIFGRDGSEVSAEDIGVVLDNPLYVEDWTITDLRRAIVPFYRRWDDAAFTERLKQFGLDSSKRIKELSRGMGIKLQIAVALSHRAKLLILDEPTSGLDPVARDEVCDLLRNFVTDDSHSVLFSTHITSDLEKIADYITFILAGRIVFTGATEDLLTSYVRVAGDPRDLSIDQASRIIGYSQHPTGFDGMLAAGDLQGMPSSVLVESPSLDDMIIYMNRGRGSASLEGGAR